MSTARGTGAAGDPTISTEDLARASQREREVAFARDEVARLAAKVAKQESFADDARQALADAQARLAALEG